MGNPAKRRASYDDLLAAPSHQIAELIHGELVTQPRPASRHARACSVLGVLLGGPFDVGRPPPSGGWLLLDEPELHLASDVLVPDLAGWLRERMPELPDVAAFSLAPDWVGEVLSPSTAAVDRAEKMPIYARERVAHVWLIDPLLQLLEVFRLDGPTYRAVASARGSATIHAEPFAELALELRALW